MGRSVRIFFGRAKDQESAIKDRAEKFDSQTKDRIEEEFQSIDVRTEYVQWIWRFSNSHVSHIDYLGETEIRAFLTELATNGSVAKSTQRQAMSALLCYRKGGSS